MSKFSYKGYATRIAVILVSVFLIVYFLPRENRFGYEYELNRPWKYGQLIARRVRDLHVYSEIVPCDISAEEVAEMAPSAIILSGGPASVYAEDAPSIDPAIFDLGLPVLGFCYGHQIMAVTLGGEVAHSEVGEYGPATIERERESAQPGSNAVRHSNRS